MPADSPVAALLELLPVVDIYAQIQEAVRQWLGNKDHVSLEPERGERYRACVMPFYYILCNESRRRGLSFWGASNDERVLVQAFSSSHDVLATDCASLVAGKIKKSSLFHGLRALNCLAAANYDTTTMFGRALPGIMGPGQQF